jgi:hypothetical protein
MPVRGYAGYIWRLGTVTQALSFGVPNAQLKQIISDAHFAAEVLALEFDSIEFQESSHCALRRVSG